jgi:hypothetical protein
MHSLISAGPRPETFQLPQFRFDSRFLFGNHRLLGYKKDVVALVFDFRHVLSNLPQRINTQQDEYPANLMPDIGHIRWFILQETQMRTERTERKDTPTLQYSFSQTTEHQTVEV